jgi:hypothetical protein
MILAFILDCDLRGKGEKQGMTPGGFASTPPCDSELHIAFS